jgi:hypothetical protein
MKVSVFSDAGELLWWRESDCTTPTGFTSASYLRDGTQDQIIGALSEALEQAQGQLRSVSLQIVDAVERIRV